MRLKDLNTTTEYAYRSSKHHTPQKILVLDSTQLYISARRRSSTTIPVPAPKGARATIGTGFYDPTIGVLYRDANAPTGQPQLAMPQHIISTWAEWLVQDVAEKEDWRKQQEYERNKQQTNAQNAERLRKLAEKHPEFKLGHISPYRSDTEVPYTVLIQILEALPSHV